MKDIKGKQMREELHRMVDMVTDPYLEDLRWTLQQYAAKGRNEEYKVNLKKRGK